MKMGTLFIIVGSLLVVVGVIINFSGNSMRRSPQTSVSRVEKESASDVQHSNKSYEIPEGNTSYNRSSETNSREEEKQGPKPDYKEIGNDFEGYVADILNKNEIRLKQWNQGATSPGGAYAENELNPDFFVVQQDDSNQLEYWVECKYRSKVPNSGFTLEDYQLNRYKSIQAASKRKIVIALGVGGSPKNPNEFYVIPLDTISQFKRIGKRFLPNYALQSPEDNFKKHLADWFHKEVFKK